MAVYTKLSRKQIESMLDRYQLGKLLSVEPVLDGIENTNYFISVASTPAGAVGEYLLTVFEQLESSELTFYMRWLSQLKNSGLPVAPAIVDVDGRTLQQLVNRPAALFNKLEGSHPQQTNHRQCHAIGAALGRLHAAALEIRESHAGPRGLSWLIKLAESIRSKICPSDRATMDRALISCQRLLKRSDLPHGLIHGDLFPDNALFKGNQLTGMVDFFSGGEGLFGFDLAVAINAWCEDARGALNERKHQALVAGYQNHRAISLRERELWADFLIVAATRFWVSRLADRLLPATGNMQDSFRKSKDPEVYRRILQNHLDRSPMAPL